MFIYHYYILIKFNTPNYLGVKKLKNNFTVVFSNNTIYSLLFLIFTFILAAFLLLLLECESLAFITLLLYIGVIAVFLLFTIVMFEPKLTYLSKNKLRYFSIGSIFALTLLIPILNILNNFFNETASIDSFYFNTYQNGYALIDNTHYIAVYGQVLYSYFVLQFLVVGLILLLTIIRVVCLTNSVEKQTLQQATFKQLFRKVKIFKRLNSWKKKS